MFEGKRAVGVRYRVGNDLVEARAAHEVVLSAGALQSPQLLMLSGIGDGEQLSRHGIEVLHHLPEVGRNLQDHLQSRLMYKCSKPITTNDALRTVWGRTRIGLQWLLFKSGPVAAGIQLGGLFASTVDGVDRPDIQFHFGTISADMTAGTPHDFSGFTMSVCQLRPTSRGEVSLRSPDPRAAPSVLFNYLATEKDQATMVRAVRMARKLARTPSLSPYILDEYRPGFGVESDDDVLAFIRDHGTTIFHPVGTCRMGSDPMSVVDARLKVRGIDGLRVVDASIMPLLVSGNTNAAVIAIGEKGADLIREDARQAA